MRNRLISGATYGNLIVGFPVYGNLPARIGAVIAGMLSESKIIAANASSTITIGGATKLVVRVRDASSAYVGTGEFFTDPNTTVVETADPSSKFSVNGGGATSDGQIWLSQSGGTLTITNRTTTTVTANIGGFCAEF